MSTQMSMIATRGLQLAAGGRTLVSGLDWQVRAGECWCVIGRNGAGKSTLLRTLAGLMPPAAGRIEIRGRPLPDWTVAELARERAFLPQARSDAFGYRAIETVLAARYPYSDRYWESEEDVRIALAALQEMDAAGLAERDVRSLSGGERQRVAIAAVLAQDTPCLLLDEPANALDLAHQAGVMQLLGRLHGRAVAHKAIVMVGHDLNLAHGAATHALLLMGEGRWLAGSVADTMTSGNLGACLGHPVDVLRHDGRTIYLPGSPQSAGKEA